DVGIVAYVVSQDGEEIARTDGATLTMDVNELSPWTDYTFAVSALDLAGNMSVQPLSVMQRTPDNQAPAFPAGGSLTIVNLTSTSATVRWPAATDDVGVHRYAVALDGAPQPSLGGQATEIRLDQLRAMRAYLVTVRAYDAADNPSGELATTINTPDGGPPTWGNGRLTGTAGINEAVLVWDSAVDDVAVTGYRVFQGQAQVYEGVDRQYRVDSLAAETSYTFRVEAGDAAGNWSSDGPTTTLTTAKAYDPGFKRLTKAQYTRTISDLFGQLWEDRYAARIALGFDEGVSTNNTSEANFNRLMTQNWGYANLYRTTYPEDKPIPGADTPRGGFKRLDAVVHAEHVASWVGVVMYHTAAWSTWLGVPQAIEEPCEFEFYNDLRNAPDLSTAYRQCVMELIDEFAPRALRRPITPEERDEFIGVYDEIPQVYADQNLNDAEVLRTGVGHVLAVIALQPEVSYQVEVGDDNGRLTAYELASRLSYHFWNTMPDDALFAAAADGSLMTEQGYATQVERLFNDPRSDRALREFYADFFRTDTLHDLNQQDAPGGERSRVAYHQGPNVEAGPIPHWNNSRHSANGILGSMRSELINLGRYFTQLSPGTFEEMFRSNLHLMECNNPSYDDQSECDGAGPYAQAIYGIDGDCMDFDDCAERSWVNANIGWDGVSAPIEIPDETRVGLITRMAFLGHDTYQARPIRRGLLIREMLLCDPIPPPENCDVVQPPSLSGRCTDAAGVEGDDCTGDAQCGDNETCIGWDRSVTMTVREKVEELTEQPNTSCVQCHSTLINGFGHALGHFSSLGKYWETEHMFTTQRNADDEFWYFGATPDQWQPIDTASSTIMNGRVVQFDGAQAVADILVDS
ncbi:MAG: DUF1592 domain-containing protein, partial [Myxococcota bacterium]|nr:DUF1592 domain-containing protein [Myxococcota bacterium]